MSDRRLTVMMRMGWGLWLLLLFTIPVSSSPLVARFSDGETPVSPLALIPLILLVFIVLLPYFVRGGTFPALTWPLLVFVVVTLVSAAASFLLPLIPFKNQVHTDRLIRGLLTLAIGLCFYFAAVIIPRGDKRLRLSLRALYAGLFLLLIWASVQAWLVLDGSDRVPLIITRVHHVFSVRDPLGDRVTGMAYEPSWLGDQLVVLYIPFLLASVGRKFSVFSKGNRAFSVEFLLLIWSFAILLLTQSRISLLSLVVVVSGIYFYLGFQQLRKVVGVFRLQPGRLSAWIGGILTLTIIWALAVIAVGWVLSQVDDRLTYLLRAPKRLEEFGYFFPNEAGFALANRLAFAERITYWTVGLRTFSRYPLLGVGPGNTGFFFQQHLPAFGHQLTEIRDVLNLGEFGFPNTKNLWIKLLAEGGLLGFGSFLTWYLISASGAYSLWRNRGGVFEVIGLAGVIGALTFFVEGFSLDSYALPQGWILFGLVASALWSQRTRSNDVHSSRG